jgi:hypothetical protein
VGCAHRRFGNFTFVLFTIITWWFEAARLGKGRRPDFPLVDLVPIMLSQLFAMMPMDAWITVLGTCAAIAVVGVFVVRAIGARDRESRRHFPLSVIAVIAAIGFGVLLGVLEALGSYHEPLPWELFWGRVFFCALIGVFVGFLLLVVVDLPRHANRSEPTNKT